MYTVILGAGTVGYKIASWLNSSGVEITIIEKDPVRIQQTQDAFGSVVVVGDGTDVDILDAAGVKRADLFAATLGYDDQNLVACQIAKHKFRVNKTISLVHQSENEELFSTLGVDFIVNVNDLIINDMESKTAAMLVEEV